MLTPLISSQPWRLLLNMTGWINQRPQVPSWCQPKINNLDYLSRRFPSKKRWYGVILRAWFVTICIYLHLHWYNNPGLNAKSIQIWHWHYSRGTTWHRQSYISCNKIGWFAHIPIYGKERIYHLAVSGLNPLNHLPDHHPKYAWHKVASN